MVIMSSVNFLIYDSAPILFFFFSFLWIWFIEGTKMSYMTYKMSYKMSYMTINILDISDCFLKVCSRFFKNYVFELV